MAALSPLRAWLSPGTWLRTLREEELDSNSINSIPSATVNAATTAAGEGDEAGSPSSDDGDRFSEGLGSRGEDPVPGRRARGFESGASNALTQEQQEYFVEARKEGEEDSDTLEVTIEEAVKKVKPTRNIKEYDYLQKLFANAVSPLAKFTIIQMAMTQAPESFRRIMEVLVNALRGLKGVVNGAINTFMDTRGWLDDGQREDLGAGPWDLSTLTALGVTVKNLLRRHKAGQLQVSDFTPEVLTRPFVVVKVAVARAFDQFGEVYIRHVMGTPTKSFLQGYGLDTSSKLIVEGEVDPEAVRQPMPTESVYHVLLTAAFGKTKDGREDVQKHMESHGVSFLVMVGRGESYVRAMNTFDKVIALFKNTATPSNRHFCAFKAIETTMKDALAGKIATSDHFAKNEQLIKMVWNELITDPSFETLSEDEKYKKTREMFRKIDKLNNVNELAGDLTKDTEKFVAYVDGVVATVGGTGAAMTVAVKKATAEEEMKAELIKTKAELKKLKAERGSRRGGGGGRSGRGGRGGRGRVDTPNGCCRICAEEGHWARECPNIPEDWVAGVEDGGREFYQGSIEHPMICYDCNDKGHEAKVCPKRFDESQSIIGSNMSRESATTNSVVSDTESEE